jgi:hypothetical protein
MAVTDQFQQQHVEKVVQKKLGQGLEERLHPGTPTFGHASHEVQEGANVHASRPEGESATHPDERGQK